MSYRPRTVVAPQADARSRLERVLTVGLTQMKVSAMASPLQPAFTTVDVRARGPRLTAKKSGPRKTLHDRVQEDLESLIRRMKRLRDVLVAQTEMGAVSVYKKEHEKDTAELQEAVEELEDLQQTLKDATAEDQKSMYSNVEKPSGWERSWILARLPPHVATVIREAR